MIEGATKLSYCRTVEPQGKHFIWQDTTDFWVLGQHTIWNKKGLTDQFTEELQLKYTMNYS